MPNPTESESSGDDFCRQKWLDLQHNHELLAAKRIDAEDGRRELDEIKAVLDNCAEVIRKRCLAVQSRASNPGNIEDLLQATHNFMKVQERLEPKEKRYDQDVAELIQLEGKCTELASQVFGEASRRTFEVMLQHVQAIPEYDLDDGVQEDKDLTVTEVTDRHDEWDPPNSPFTELLGRLESLESQIMSPHSPEVGSPGSPSSVVARPKALATDKVKGEAFQNSQSDLSDLCRMWNEASMQLHQHPLDEQLPEDDEVPKRPPETKLGEDQRLKLNMLHHSEIPSLPRSLAAKASGLGQALHCRPYGITEIGVEDIARIRSGRWIGPEAVSTRLKLRHEHEDFSRWPIDAVAARRALNVWLLDQLLTSEENLGIYTTFLSQKPKLLDMDRQKLQKLIHDNWNIDDTEVTNANKSVQLETTQIGSKQAQPDIEHLSVDIEPVDDFFDT